MRSFLVAIVIGSTLLGGRVVISKAIIGVASSIQNAGAYIQKALVSEETFDLITTEGYVVSWGVVDQYVRVLAIVAAVVLLADWAWPTKPPKAGQPVVRPRMKRECTVGPKVYS